MIEIHFSCFSLRFKERERAIVTIAVEIVGRLITIMRATQKRSHKLIFKTDTNSEAKRIIETKLE